MKRGFICLILLFVFYFLGADPYLIYAGPLSDKLLKHDPGCPNANLEAGDPEISGKGVVKSEAELEEEMEKEDKAEIDNLAKHKRLIYEKLAKRTKECRDALDGEFFTISSHARKATEAKDIKSEREFISLLSDYNSVLGDLGLMQVLLDLGKLVEAESEKFLDYYELLESGYERLKDSFSLKNELFLSRIDKLKNQFALHYEKKLLRDYKEYFQYDPRLERVAEPEIDKGERK